MKKIIIVLIITSLLLALVIVEQIYIDSTFNTLISKISELSTAVSTAQNINTESIINNINELDDYWTYHEKILCISINHNDLNKIGEQFKKIKVYIEQDNKEDCEYEISILLFYSNSYKQVMEIKLQNVL